MKSKKHTGRSLWRDNQFSFLAAILAAVIMLFVYMCYRFFPLGDNIILRMDLYHQYAPLFAELYDRIFQGNSLLYSFTSGFGSGFLGNYFNYLSSPTMLFVLIFGHANVPEAVAAMILTKASVSAFTFSYMLKRVTGKYDLTSTAFGLMYAFSGWFVAYYWNVMWLDAMSIFPLVVLGIYLIINKYKPTMYIVTLALTLITNYYMGYMVCILSVIMFLYMYFSQYTFSQKEHPDYIIKLKYRHSAKTNFFNSKFLRSGTLFAFASIGAACIAAFSLIPVYFALKHSSATSSTFPTDYSTYFNMFDFLANHLPGLKTTIRSSGDDVLPNVYCGTLTLILVPLYFFSKKFNLREKLATTITLAFFFFSFNVNYLNYIWHGFHFPNDLPYRFSFAYSFFLLFIAYKVIISLDKISLKACLGSSVALVAFIVAVEKLGSKNVSSLSIWTGIAFAIIYAVIFALMKDKKQVKSYICVLLACAVCTEILVANTSNYVISQDKSSYVEGYNEVNDCIDYIDEIEGKDSFYRMELASIVRRMDNCWYGYNGASTFTSMAYEDLSHLMNKMGLSGNDINSYTYHCQTAVFNTLFGIDYIVDNSEYTKTDNYKTNFGPNLYEDLTTINNMTVYDYLYDLPLMFSSKSDVDTLWDFNNNNPFDVQSQLWSLVTGVDGVFDDLDISVVSQTDTVTLSDDNVNNGTFTLTKTSSSDDSAELMLKVQPEETKNVYLYISCNDCSTGYVTINGNMITVDFSEPFIIDCGLIEGGDDVYVTLGLDEGKNSAPVTAYAKTLNDANFKKGYDTINSNGVFTFDDKKFSDSHFSGTVSVQENGMIFTSVPYDESWNIFIDGEKVSSDNIVKIGNAFTGIYTSAGEHSIEFKYTPKGLLVGCAVSAAAIVIFILLVIMKKKKVSVFSAKYKNDNLDLGKWRDFAAEEEREQTELEKQAQQNVKSEFDDELSAFYPENQTDAPAAADSSWESVLNEADEWKKTQEKAKALAQAQIDAIMAIENGMDSELKKKQENPTVIKETIIEKPAKATKKFKATTFSLIAILFVIIACLVLLLTSLNSMHKKNNEAQDQQISLLQDEISGMRATANAADTTKETTTEAETTTKTAETTTKAPETTTKAPETTTKTPETTTSAPKTDAPVAGGYKTYTVQSGDYPFSILRKNGLEPNKYLQEFYRINGGKQSFSVGDVVNIPNS